MFLLVCHPCSLHRLKCRLLQWDGAGQMPLLLSPLYSPLHPGLQLAHPSTPPQLALLAAVISNPRAFLLHFSNMLLIPKALVGGKTPQPGHTIHFPRLWDCTPHQRERSLDSSKMGPTASKETQPLTQRLRSSSVSCKSHSTNSITSLCLGGTWKMFQDPGTPTTLLYPGGPPLSGSHQPTPAG